MKSKAQHSPAQLNLFDSSPETMTVTQVTRYVKSLLDGDYVLQDLWVEGEVSNFKVTSAGHAYFSLKDDQASLRCVMWRSDVRRQDILPQDGQSVLAHGRVSVYEVAGSYQLYVDHLQLAGMGHLYLEFEALKRRLAEEGLFDATRKRPLPPFPRRLGVVTSPTAAALRDILNVLARRYPLAQVVLSPTLVQGDQAPPQIVAAIQALNDYTDIDVIILARGGGSLEELWAFNDERVARAIAASRVPVVSGVGHEIDFTIADFAADVRAPTPSAAAELAVPHRAELLAAVRGQRTNLGRVLQRRLDNGRQSLTHLARALWRNSPLGRIESLRQRVDELSQATGVRLGHLLALRREQLNGLAGRLATLSPFATLDRGYAIVRHGKTGRVVTSVGQVTAGESIAVRVRDGGFDATVSRSILEEDIKFTGLLLRESLKDDSVLDVIRITKTETWNVGNAADFQPKIWTAIFFEGEGQADVIAEKLSQSLKPRGWYINISTKKDVYVIFPNKVFEYTRGDKQKRAEAKKYGQSLDIPDDQLDWGE